MGSLRVDEEEQDANWALKNQLISPDEYKQLLLESGLDASDLEFV